MAFPVPGTGDTYTRAIIDGALGGNTIANWAFPAGGAVVNCDVSTASTFKFNGGTTLTVTTSNAVHGRYLMLTFVGASGMTVTLPTIKWLGTAPNLAIPANVYATLTLRYDSVIDGGTWVEVARSGFLPGWIAPTLGGSMANLGGGWATAGYYKDGAGIVRCKGAVAGAGLVANAVIYTLPAGFRPAQFQLRPQMSLNGSAVWGAAGLNINTSGAVAISFLSGTTALSIDFNFPAEL